MAVLTDYIKQVCRPGQGSACCKYLVMDSDGFSCMKANPANKAVIDRNWAKTEHLSQGDNCEGKSELQKAILNADPSHQEEAAAEKK